MDPQAPTPTTFKRMVSVKAACDRAPAGPGKDLALQHYRRAELAETAKNDAACNLELDCADRALG